MPKFRSFLPRLTTFGAALTDDDYDAEGIFWQVRWGPLFVELTFAKEVRGGGSGR